MTIRQTRRTDLNYRQTHTHPRGIGAVVCSTLLVCSECGVGNYAAQNAAAPMPWGCTVCPHGVDFWDIHPHLDAGESVGHLTLEDGRRLLTVDVYVDRDSIDTRPEG